MRTEKEVNDALRLLRRQLGVLAGEFGYRMNPTETYRIEHSLNALMWVMGDECTSLEFLLDDLNAVHGEPEGTGFDCKGERR